MLRCVVQSARNLPNVEKFGKKSDPYTRLTFKGEQKKTKTIENELNPEWNEMLEFDLKGFPLDANSVLVVEVKDFEKIGKSRFLGSAQVQLQELLTIPGNTNSYVVNLLNEKQQSTGATLSLQVGYIAPPGTGPPPSQRPPGDPMAKSDATGGGDEGEEDDEEDADSGIVQGGGDTGDGGVAGKPPRGNIRKKKSKRVLSNKPQDFQVRVRIIDGRQLAGNNIKPVVRVSVAGQNKRTRIKKGNNPYFDETFFFNIHDSPRELFDEVINIRVFNATTIRADSEIGGFKIDIGTVYDESTHSFLRKWLLLSDPEDVAAGARGYLKVSLFVLATGDEAPVEKKEKTEDEEDIENNLLRPAGVNLRGAVFSLRVYRAEDVPQMDDAILQGVKEVFGMEGNKKNLVDPFLEVTFAGKKECSRIIQKNANPEWNETLNLPVRFPSMCERMKLTLLDWDRLSHNDTIGTAFLSMSKISFAGGTLEDETSISQGASCCSVDDTTGFLPTFGPCYVNFYGSLREFSTFTDKYEDLNRGKGEGMSYRGRMLIELITQLDAKVHRNVEPIANDDLLRVEKYMRRRKFNLYAAFYTAGMMQHVDEAVQFEVSIGNYGNKFDSTCMPLASTTQYSRSVFDGCQYYFLPWANTKPVVTLTSHWEDISHRLQALNILLYSYERLDLMLGKLKMALQAKLPQQQLASVWLSLIDQVLEDCSIPMPSLDGCANVTPLDVQRRKLRMLHLNQVVEGARCLRNEATEVEKTLPEIEDWLDTIRSLAEEPQNSLPDVVVWMVCGEKRVAYARIPAHEVLYSNKGMKTCGKYCGRTRTIFLKYPEDQTKNNKIPVQLRIRMWLGMAADEKKFNESSEGKLTVFAETYENQCTLFGTWGTKGLTRHKWTDVTGKIKLKKETFLPPVGWKWDGDWYIDPERSMLMDADAGHTIFADEVFQSETRMPGRDWQPSDSHTDVNGDNTQSRNDIEVPAGWFWIEDWCVDQNRAVDEDGWEYGLVLPLETRPKQWVSAEKMYHVYRRRRWLRRRQRDPKQMDMARQKLEKLVTEGWEYASLFGWKFHLEQKSTDTQRRRRWRRCMAPAERLGHAAVFALEGALGGGGEEDEGDSSKEDKDEKSAKSVLGVNTPTISCIFDKPQKYHLRCYIYQARDLVAMDKESFSDPYAVVSFLTQSQKTETIKTTLNPTWDQTLIFHEIDIYGDPSSTELYPPSVVVEVFDFDTFGKNEFMGRVKCTPLVKLRASDDLTPKLAWYPLQQGGKDRGELLAAFELIKKEKPDGSDLPFPPPKRSSTVFMVPQGIKPVLQRTKIEILAWGLRNLKSYQLLGVTSPSLVIECGGVIVQSPVIKNVKKNPNFSNPVLSMEVRLPKEEIYTPPIVIKVIDNRQFGRKPVVAQLTVKELEDYRCDPEAVDGQLQLSVGGGGRARASSDVVLNIASDDSKPLLTSQFWGNLGSSVPSPLTRATPVSPIDEKDTIDWWSKFYASSDKTKEKCGTYLDEGHDTLKIYDTMLEEVPEFQNLNDFCRTFKLFRGKQDDESDDPSVVGEFKGSFKIYPLPDDPSQASPPAQYQHLPDIGPQECIVRVYIVQAEALQPKDTNGLCDPYIKLNLGKTTIDDHDKYLPNTLNPVFGRMYELTCTLPLEKDLKISVYDYDLVGRDEKIGETFIDLENRYLSRFGARCGLPQSFCVSGNNQWRDQMTPTVILERVATAKSWPMPIYEEDRITLKGRDYLLADFETKAPMNPHLGPVKERLALHLLRSIGLIPEHVETRTLEHSIQPGLEQGKLMMWVDLFPKNLGPPGPPFDITPRKAKKFQLRCIIWNTKDVILDETSITGERMSDIYVKGWLDGLDNAKQKTDVHYRSLGGEGNFNWRLVFPFEYIPAENICVVSRKEHFWSLDKTELRLPPKFTIQIWDNDKFSPDDYLGYLDLNLSHMPMPAKSADKCSLDMMETPVGKKKHTMTSLFEQRNVKGWWPCTAEENGKKIIAGKVEMTLEILTDKEAEERPAALGREEPNMNPKLDPPNRPETSFLWFTSPFKTFKHIIWRRYKWVFIGLLILLIVLLFFAILLYSLPNYTAQKIVLG